MHFFSIYFREIAIESYCHNEFNFLMNNAPIHLTPQELQSASRRRFQDAVDNKDNVQLQKQEYYPAYWHAFKRRAAEFTSDTGVPSDTLKHIVRNGTLPPETFHIHPQLRSILERRIASVQNGEYTLSFLCLIPPLCPRIAVNIITLQALTHPLQTIFVNVPSL